jgi:pimeloyl-ACP methyl ester carboxylesterase
MQGAALDNEPARLRDEIVTLDGLRLHYRDWGNPTAPPVVLLHAYTQHARSWDPVARGLAKRFRVLALDQRGHGESAWAADYHELRLVADLAGFVETLGLTTVSLVGFSIGGSAAISYAQLYPDRVERLVAFECFTDAEEPGDAPYWHAMRAHLGLLRSLPETFERPEDAVAAFRPLAPYAAEEELRHWTLRGLKQGADGNWTWRYDPILRTPASTPGRLNASPDVLAKRLAGVSCATLLLAGAESWMVEPTQRMVTLNPRARMITVPRAGHWVPLDNPSEFLAVVGQFLTTE